jgi:hypothetical protein
MVKLYKGNAPDSDEGWELIGEGKDDDGVQWLVFKKPQDHNDDWATYKICAKTKAKAKGNYWAVRKKSGQLAFVKDMAQMREYRPKLHAFVERVMREND